MGILLASNSRSNLSEDVSEIRAESAALVGEDDAADSHPEY